MTRKLIIIQRKIKIKHLNELIKKSTSDGKDYHA